MPYSRSDECYLAINRFAKQQWCWQITELCVYACLVKFAHTLLVFPFYLIVSGHGQFNIPFSRASMNSLALLSLLCFSAPSCLSHSFMAENSSLTFPNKKHTLQVSNRGRLHASVTGQTRSLTFFSRSPLLTGWDMTFFLFGEKQPPQMFTTLLPLSGFLHSFPWLMPSTQA